MDIDDIEQIFRARAADFSRLGASVRFDLGAGSLHVDGTKNPAEITRADADADTVIGVSAADLERLMEGRLDATMAYMTGKLKVKGDTGVAMKLASVLK